MMIQDKGAVKEQNVPGRERAEIWETGSKTGWKEWGRESEKCR